MTTTTLIRVYTASKLHHALRLRKLRLTPEAQGLYFTARWPILDQTELSDRPTDHWLGDNIDDITRSHAMLVYIERGEHLRIGLIEVGIAIRQGLPIWLVDPFIDSDDAISSHPDYADWRGLTSVHRVQSLEAACSLIKAYFYPDQRIKV